jgi:hypothetical protein
MFNVIKDIKEIKKNLLLREILSFKTKQMNHE